MLGVMWGNESEGESAVRVTRLMTQQDTRFWEGPGESTGRRFWDMPGGTSHERSDQVLAKTGDEFWNAPALGIMHLRC